MLVGNGRSFPPAMVLVVSTNVIIVGVIVRVRDQFLGHRTTPSAPDRSTVPG